MALLLKTTYNSVDIVEFPCLDPATIYQDGSTKRRREKSFQMFLKKQHNTHSQLGRSRFDREGTFQGTTYTGRELTIICVASRLGK